MADEIKLPRWMLAMIPLVSLLIGIGATYGIAKTTMNENRRRITVLEQKVDILMEVRSDVKWIKREIMRKNNEEK